MFILKAIYTGLTTRVTLPTTSAITEPIIIGKNHKSWS